MFTPMETSPLPVMSANVDLYLAPTVINPVRQRKSVFVVIFEEPYILQHLNAIYIYICTNVFILFLVTLPCDFN